MIDHESDTVKANCSTDTTAKSAEIEGTIRLLMHTLSAPIQEERNNLPKPVSETWWTGCVSDALNDSKHMVDTLTIDVCVWVTDITLI